ncbi:MAG: PEP-utilizing enzyme, partial [Cyanobacteria bacterium J06626_23]
LVPGQEENISVCLQVSLGQPVSLLRHKAIPQVRQQLVVNLQANGDIFFLTWDEVRFSLGEASPAHPMPWSNLSVRIAARQAQWQADSETRPPYLAYGDDPPEAALAPRPASQAQVLQGIGASPGQIEGEIRIVTSLEGTTGLDSTPLPTGTILVVPYTDAGWAPLFTHIGGLVAEVGGQLSHGAIVAREFGIPAVMDVTDATHRLVDGQRVRLDGQRGTIEIL